MIMANKTTHSSALSTAAEKVNRLANAQVTKDGAVQGDGAQAQLEAPVEWAQSVQTRPASKTAKPVSKRDDAEQMSQDDVEQKSDSAREWVPLYEVERVIDIEQVPSQDETEHLDEATEESDDELAAALFEPAAVPIVAPLGGGLLSLGGLATVGLAAGGGGSSSTQTPIQPLPNLTISGSVLKGPVFQGVSVYAYDTEGNKLGQSNVSDDGTFNMVLARPYAGPLLLKAMDENGAEVNYRSELGADRDLGVALRAIAEVPTGASFVIINITPLTELAVRRMGVDTTNPRAPIDVDMINASNRIVGQAFNLDNVHDSVIVVNAPNFDASDGLSPAEIHGIKLALFEGLVQSEGTVSNALDAFGRQIVEVGGQGGLNPGASSLLSKGV
jgi:hypothetical protein